MKYHCARKFSLFFRLYNVFSLKRCNKNMIDSPPTKHRQRGKEKRRTSGCNESSNPEALQALSRPYGVLQLNLFASSPGFTAVAVKARRS